MKPAKNLDFRNGFNLLSHKFIMFVSMILNSWILHLDILLKSFDLILGFVFWEFSNFLSSMNWIWVPKAFFPSS